MYVVPTIHLRVVDTIWIPAFVVEGDYHMRTSDSLTVSVFQTKKKEGYQDHVFNNYRACTSSICLRALYCVSVTRSCDLPDLYSADWHILLYDRSPLQTARGRIGRMPGYDFTTHAHSSCHQVRAWCSG